MPRLLHVDTSLRTDGSRTRALTLRVAERWRAAHPGGLVQYRDLAAAPAPHVDLDTFTANLAAPDERTPAQRAARARTDELVGEVLAADTIVLGVPLYNFGPPSTLKAWFDHLVVPGVTLGAEGGLLGGRRLIVVQASGGGYGPGTPRHGWDHREPWLHHAFAQLGLTDVHVVHAELTLARESPAMVPLDLGAAEDASFAAAEQAVDALPIGEPVPA